MKRLVALFLMAFSLFFLSGCDLFGDEDPEVTDVEITLASDVEAADLTVDPHTIVPEGTQVTVSASAVSGYAFLHWYDVDLGAVASEDSTYTFDADTDFTLEAVYEETATATILVESAHPDAILTADPETLPIGETTLVTASQIEGYIFEGWMDTGTAQILSDEMSYSFVAEGDLTLEALYAQAPPDTSDILDDFIGDLSHLDSVMAHYENSDAVTSEMTFFVEEAFNGGSEGVTLHMRQAVFTDPHPMTDTLIEIETPDEDMRMRLIVVSESASMTLHQVYLDIGMFLDIAEEEDDISFRELFALESDFVHLTVPDIFLDEMWDMFMDEVADDLEEDGFAPDELKNMLEGLADIMDKYLDLDYYNALDGLDVEAYEENGEIVTVMTMDSDLISTMHEDITEDLYKTIALFDTEMKPYEEFIEDEEYLQMQAMIETIEPFEVAMIYDPHAQSMRMNLNIIDLLGQFAEEGDLDGMTMEFSVAVTPEGEAPDTSDAESIERIASEIFQMLMIVQSHHFAERVHESTLPTDTYTLQALAEEGYHFDMPILDLDLSEIVIDDDPGEFMLEFHYSNNEEAVFIDPISLEVLQDLEPDSDDVPTREEFLDMIAYVDEGNIELQSMLFEVIGVLLAEMEPPEPIGPIIPEEDIEGSEDYYGVDRYPGSVIVHYHESDTAIDIQYEAETTVESVYEFYMNFFEESPFDILEVSEDQWITAIDDSVFVAVDVYSFVDVVTIYIYIEEGDDGEPLV